MCKQKRRRSRRGATLLLMLLLIVIILGMSAFAFDIGRMQLVRCQLQTAVDAGSIAGTLQLKKDPSNLAAAQLAAENYVQRQRVGFLGAVQQSDITVDIGKWTPNDRKFKVTSDNPNSIRVQASQIDEPFLFAGIFGHSKFSIPRESIAVAGPSKVDVAMVLDLSSSMGSGGRIEALRDAAPVFVEVIKDLNQDDKLAIMGYGVEKDNYGGGVYTAAPANLFPSDSDYEKDWVGVLEKPLTSNFDSVISDALSPSDLVANKYGGGTPNGAAIRDAAHYLDDKGRNNVEKRMVLMSDGHANQPSSDPEGYALQMAGYANGLGIKIYTISLGSEADMTLMTGIANATGGMHFDATGSTASLSIELSNAFVSAANEIKKAMLVQ